MIELESDYGSEQIASLEYGAIKDTLVRIARRVSIPAPTEVRHKEKDTESSGVLLERKAISNRDQSRR